MALVAILFGILAGLAAGLVTLLFGMGWGYVALSYVLTGLITMICVIVLLYRRQQRIKATNKAKSYRLA